MKSLKGKNVVVTGAGSGIGRLMALRCAREGANLAIVDINRQAVEAVREELLSHRVKAGAFICDISDNTAVSKTCDAITSFMGQVDVLINNAGVVTGKDFLDLSIKEMERTMNINFWGHTYFTRAILPGMAKRNSGNIVNIASSSGLLGLPKLTDYAASKFAEVGFSEALRRELKDSGLNGIRITVVCPYTIDTGMFKGFKPMLMSPILKPEYVADRVIDLMKKGRPYAMLPPASIRLSMFMKLLPTGILDWTLKATGGYRTMDHYTGRK